MEKLILKLLVLAALACLIPVVVHDVTAAEPVWGPAIGSKVELRAQDDSGRERTLADLSGRQGLLLFLNRSADW